ncbi:unnamed protein product [Calypogeia fissa]
MWFRRVWVDVASGKPQSFYVVLHKGLRIPKVCLENLEFRSPSPVRLYGSSFPVLILMPVLVFLEPAPPYEPKLPCTVRPKYIALDEGPSYIPGELLKLVGRAN